MVQCEAAILPAAKTVGERLCDRHRDQRRCDILGANGRKRHQQPQRSTEIVPGCARRLAADAGGQRGEDEDGATTRHHSPLPFAAIGRFDCTVVIPGRSHGVERHRTIEPAIEQESEPALAFRAIRRGQAKPFAQKLRRGGQVARFEAGGRLRDDIFSDTPARHRVPYPACAAARSPQSNDLVGEAIVAQPATRAQLVEQTRDRTGIRTMPLEVCARFGARAIASCKPAIREDA
jgi:hypothetical protein